MISEFINYMRENLSPQDDKAIVDWLQVSAELSEDNETFGSIFLHRSSSAQVMVRRAQTGECRLISASRSVSRTHRADLVVKAAPKRYLRMSSSACLVKTSECSSGL